MSTFVDGIAASENIDSSGERISIAGMDISSLPIDGVANFEHESKHPDQIVGKVLAAKKIFSEKDADDDRQLYFWNKCKTPYVYVLIELFDDYKDSAREVAGMFRYDQDKKDQNERNVMNFSIEGAKILKQGIDIVKSIARKVTITVLPANKAAVAEMVPAKSKQKDDIDGLFKTETTVEIEIFKTEDMGKFLDNLKKSAPGLKVAAPSADPRGTHMGNTSSGKAVHSHERVGNYKGFGSAEHKEAMNMHYKAAQRSTDVKTTQHHLSKMKLHMTAAQSAEKRETRMQNVPHGNVRGGTALSRPEPSVHRPYSTVGNLKKTLTAGSANAAPGQLTGGAALAKQDLDKKIVKKEINEPLFHKVSGDKVTPGQKSAMGMSNMGRKVRDGNPAAKDVARKQLSNLQAQPKPNLTKEEHKHIGWDKLHSKLEGEGYSKESSDKIAGSIKAKLNKTEELLKRAQDEYSRWDKREQFEKFMSEKNPTMTKTEIMVHGQVMALKKSLENEAAMEELAKALKFGDGNYTPKAGTPDGTPKPLPKKFHDYKKQVKGIEHTEVEHVHPHYDGKSPDTVFTKAGHRLEGSEKGKFKAGDKVTVKQHVMGTHILEHSDMKKSERHESYHSEENHAKSVSDELHAKSKELGHTGSSYSFSIKGKGIHGSGFKDKESADKFADHARSHPAAHSVKQSEGHGHHFVEVNIKSPSELMKKSEEFATLEKSEKHEPKMGEIKPHLSHDEMMKLPKREHTRLAEAHKTLARSDMKHEAAHGHLMAGHMHDYYSHATSTKKVVPGNHGHGTQWSRDRAVSTAKHMHEDLSKD